MDWYGRQATPAACLRRQSSLHTESDLKDGWNQEVHGELSRRRQNFAHVFTSINVILVALISHKGMMRVVVQPSMFMSYYLH